MACMVVLLSSCDGGRDRGNIRTTFYNLPMQTALSAWRKVDFHKAGAGSTPGVTAMHGKIRSGFTILQKLTCRGLGDRTTGGYKVLGSSCRKGNSL